MVATSRHEPYYAIRNHPAVEISLQAPDGRVLLERFRFVFGGWQELFLLADDSSPLYAWLQANPSVRSVRVTPLDRRDRPVGPGLAADLEVVGDSQEAAQTILSELNRKYWTLRSGIRRTLIAARPSTV